MLEKHVKCLFYAVGQFHELWPRPHHTHGEKAMWHHVAMSYELRAGDKSAPDPALRNIRWSNRSGSRYDIYRDLAEPVGRNDMALIGVVDKVDDGWVWYARTETVTGATSGNVSTMDQAVRRIAIETWDVPKKLDGGPIFAAIIGIGVLGFIGWVLLSSLGVIG